MKRARYIVCHDMTVMTVIRTQSDFIYEFRDQQNELQSGFCLHMCCNNSAEMKLQGIFTLSHKNVWKFLVFLFICCFFLLNAVQSVRLTL